MTPATAPLDSLAGFAALLREQGLAVGVAQQQAMAQAALALGPLDERRLSAAWRSIACHNARDWTQWRELFDRYWHPHKLRGQVKVSGQTRASRDLRQAVQAMQDQMDEAAARPANESAAASLSAGEMPASDAAVESLAPRAQGGASRADALHAREGQQWLPQDLGALQHLARRIVRQLRPRPTRRWRAQADGPRLSVRQTLRASVAFGGEPVAPAWQALRHEPPRLFILADVSRSMESHAQLFLRVARAFAVEGGARVFVFHVRLAEVTPLMHRDSATVQEKVNAVTAGFGAGTRIAASLQDFARHHARAQLGRGSRVWVFSDGFDTDEPVELQQALGAIRARGARITWFHPTRQPPASTAIGLARGCIERFVPLASLADLAAARRVLN